MALRLQRIVKNICLDLKYGGRFLGGNKRTSYPDVGAHDTVNSDYSELPILFGDLIGQSDVIVDVGCGKGRVMNWLLSRGVRNNIIGIELDQIVAQECRRRLEKYPQISILAGNVLENIPNDGTVFYLYNPFQENVMQAFSDALKRSYLKKHREIKIIYSNCCCVSVFELDPCWTVSRVAADLQHPAAIVTLNSAYLLRRS